MRWVSRAAWVAGLLLRGWGCITLTSVAEAAEIDWRGPPACPDAAELRFRVERAIGMPLSHAANLHFGVTAQAARHGYVAHVDLEASPGAAPRRRSLAAPDCSRLVDLVSVTVALALGAARGELDAAAAASAVPGVAPEGARGSVSAPTQDEPAEPASAVAPTPSDDGASDVVVVVTPPSGASASWWPAVSLWFVGDTGSLPRAGAGVALGGQLESGHYALLALATWLFEQHADAAGSFTASGVTAAPGTGADLGLLAGSLAACALPFGGSASTFRAQGCAGWELGRLAGEGTGVQRPRAGAALWSAPRLDAGVSWALAAAGLRLEALMTLALPLRRDEFTLADIGSVHRPPAVVGRLAVGLKIELK